MEESYHTQIWQIDQIQIGKTLKFGEYIKTIFLTHAIKKILNN